LPYTYTHPDVKQRVLSECFYTIQGKAQAQGLRVRFPTFPYSFNLNLKTMGLTLYLSNGNGIHFEQSISHNLRTMAISAGVYECLWNGQGVSAGEAECILWNGIVDMLDRKDFYKQLEPSNKWGTYDDFLAFIGELHLKCVTNPDAIIMVCK